MSLRLSLAGGALCALLSVSCGGGDGPSASPEANVVRQYAVNLKANYQDVVGKLQDLQAAVDAFVGAPSQVGFDAARAAWLAARPGYGQCEVSRFYGGPLDDAQGRMNEWPIDENFLDYTYDLPDGGIVNTPASYPVIDVETLKSTDHMGGLENLPAGFHAIEFLLWGQRPSQEDGPGARPYTDYVDGGTAANQSRRRDYLKAATDLLLSDMQGLVAAWDLGDPNSYGSAMVAGSAHDGVQKIARGLTDMHISELYYERLLDPYVTMDRKDEESCFSESTYTDLVANDTGVLDTYHGRYGSLAGASVADLLIEVDPALAEQIDEQIQATLAAIQAIPQPFDHTVISDSKSDDHKKLDAAVQTFWPMQDLYRQMASKLGIVINL
jgi:putative iron-regulated protein